MKIQNNRKAKAKKIFEKVVNNVQTIVNSGEYKKYLKFQNNFTKYSFNNIVLIYSQNKNATKVAGKAKWKELGREVIQNPQRIQIIAAMPAKGQVIIKKIKDGKEVKEIQTYNYTKYKTVYVYDISQTIGKPIPLQVKMLDSENMAYFYEKLKQFSKIPIFEQELQRRKGYYSKVKNSIFIEKTLSTDAKVAILLHELTHALYDDFDYKTDRNLSEVFVESIAYIVADYFGIDNSMCSFNYITKYAKGNPKILVELGAKIKKCATQFIKEIEEFEDKEIKLVA